MNLILPCMQMLRILMQYLPSNTLSIICLIVILEMLDVNHVRHLAKSHLPRSMFV